MTNSNDGRKQTKAKSGGKISRKKLDTARAQRRGDTMWAHYWHVCPKCGGDMFEQESLQIRYEVCRGCHGIYFDQAEFGLAAGIKDPAKWLAAVLDTSENPETDKI